MRSEETELKDRSLTPLVNCRETILYFYLVLLLYLGWKRCEVLCCARGLWSVKKGDLCQRWGHEILEKLQQHTTSLTVQKLRTRRLQCSTKETVKVFPYRELPSVTESQDNVAVNLKDIVKGVKSHIAK